MPVRPPQRRVAAPSPPATRAASARPPASGPAALVGAALSVSLVLASCGNKGDLYLSEPTEDAAGAGTPERELDAGALPDSERPTRSPALVPEAELDGAADDVDGPGPRTGGTDVGDEVGAAKDDAARRRRGTSP